jgi:hypothetical protein
MTPNDLLENQFPLQYTAKDGMLVSSSSTESKRRHWEDRGRWYSVPGLVASTRIMVAVRSSPLLRRLKRGSHVSHHRAFMTERDDKAEWLFELMEGYLLEARDASTGLGARFAAVVIPFKQQLAGAMGPGLDPTLYGEHWVSFGATQGFPVHDLLGDFREHGDPEALYWKEDSHCSAEGYHLIGRRACEFLASEAAALGLPEAR